jgi:hypothetical protein
MMNNEFTLKDLSWITAIDMDGDEIIHDIVFNERIDIYLDYLLDNYDNIAIVYRNYVLEALDGSLAKGPYIKTIAEDVKYINNKTWTDIPN